MENRIIYGITEGGERIHYQDPRFRIEDFTAVLCQETLTLKDVKELGDSFAPQADEHFVGVRWLYLAVGIILGVLSTYV